MNGQFLENKELEVIVGMKKNLSSTKMSLC